MMWQVEQVKADNLVSTGENFLINDKIYTVEDGDVFIYVL